MSPVRRAIGDGGHPLPAAGLDAVESAKFWPGFLDDLPLPEASPMIGRYKLLEKLGEGGFGVVYVAEQKEPVKRRVALKVIKLGMDTRQVVARFEAERQALAMMDHPNIAKVLDAGATEQGRPYFAMELVRGVPITEYCDHHELGTAQRLGLLIEVCQAVQHAHMKGIIHRDLKPSNILVTLNDGVPTPKVIDFGIAKAMHGELTDKTVFTQLQQFIGTPTYISPEQAEMSGLDIDTRADIYSLGVLLYELLTGRTPFEGRELIEAGLEKMRRILREQEPVRPSTRLSRMAPADLTTVAKRHGAEAPKLIHMLRGDLDWVVMKCLEKDRTRRYETANGLAADVQRHLDNQPVIARPPTAAYRFQKMVRRNQKAFLAAVAVALALILGFSAAVVGLVRAVRAQAKETQARKQAQAQELASRRRAYAAEMSTAFHALAQNNLGHVFQMLDRQCPKPGEVDLRGFEWRCLWQQTRGNELMTWPGEGSQALAYSRDGRFLANSDKNIVVRDAKTKRLLVKLPAPADSLAFSPDGSLLASGDSDNTLLWDTRNWKQVRSLPNAHSPVKFSPDGQFLLTGTPAGYRLWQTQTWQPAGLASGLATSGGSYHALVSFSLDSRHLLTPWAGHYLEAHQLRVWSLPSLVELAPIETGGAIASGIPSAVTFSADGTRVIVSKDTGQIGVWDFQTRNVLITWNAHTNRVKSIDITPDGKRFATAGVDHTVRLWDLSTGEQVARIGTHLGEVDSLAVSPDGREVVAGGSYPPETKLWDLLARDTEPRLNGADFVFGFLDHGRLLVGNSTNDLEIWNPADGTRAHLPISKAVDVEDFNCLCVVRPDNSTVVVGRSDGTIESWSLTSREKLSTWQAHQGHVRAVGFSPDGRILASGGRDGDVTLWDFTTQMALSHFDLSRTKLCCLSISPNGRFLAASGETGLVVWDIATRKEIIRSDCGGCLAPTTTFSPDGKLLAVTAMQLNEIHLWDPTAGTLVGVLKGLIGGTFNLAISPDGLTLASSGSQVKLWNISTLQEVALIENGNTPWSLAFSPDGLALAVSYGKPIQRVSLWRAPSLAEIDAVETRKLDHH